MKNLNSYICEFLTYDKPEKHKYLISCYPSSDEASRFLVLTMSEDPELDRTKYKIFDKWKKKYPDDHPNDFEVYVDLDSMDGDYESNSKWLTKLGDAIKKDKTSMITVRQMTVFDYPNPHKYMEKFVKEAIKRGPDYEK